MLEAGLASAPGDKVIAEALVTRVSGEICILEPCKSGVPPPVAIPSCRGVGVVLAMSSCNRDN